MNTLEKKLDEERVQTAQICIGESKGTWQIIWTAVMEGGHTRAEHLYEGRHWDEVLTCFRHHMMAKLAEGYVPQVSIPLNDPIDSLSDRARWAHSLQYYSEMHLNQELLEKLRKWRRESAAKEGKAPYLLATNRMLEMVATFVPHTAEELKQIPGFGLGKVNQYGESLFAITQAAERVTHFPLNWVLNVIDRASFQQWLMEQKERKAKAELERHTRKRNMLDAIWQGSPLEEMRTMLSLSKRDTILLVEELDADGYDVSPLVDNELSDVADELKEQAWTQFEQLGDRYLKPIMEAVFTTDERKELDFDRTYQWLRLLRIRYRKAKAVLTECDTDQNDSFIVAS
ncbi:HRDC domain-containing protein [Paenibacillus sp. N1-5-1-14]|uniref:HRDC domain-containing protein n=1 Tax=Paenibacillus radicibacter TaxID=2972488 RepID=UPI0021592221|nr:HRDC domain-containing protein [Paenibacillus radicibacter]MCR8644861.1 HRDC domain-containing protein [Paenibacillus radicibacter]